MTIITYAKCMVTTTEEDPMSRAGGVPVVLESNSLRALMDSSCSSPLYGITPSIWQRTMMSTSSAMLNLRYLPARPQLSCRQVRDMGKQLKAAAS